MKKSNTSLKMNFSTFFKALKYSKGYLPLFILSLVLTAIVVALTLYVPILIGEAIELAVGAGNVNMEGIEVITLGDVADVFMTDNSADIYTNVDGNAGVMVSMQKQTGYSTGDVSHKINDKFAEMIK